MSDALGNGEILTQHARVIVTTPADVDLSISYQVLNKTNFPTLQITVEDNELIEFNQITGVFTFLNIGYLTMDAVLNFIANQASANLLMIPEFDEGAGWVSGLPRKTAMTAIRPSQIAWSGSKEIKNKNEKARFCFAEENGSIALSTEILDPGGPLEVTLPAGIFVASLQRKYSRIFMT